MPKAPPITIARASADDADPLLALYADLFHGREPLTRCIGLGRERMISIGRAMHAGSGPGALSLGLCWIARDPAAQNRDIGFIVCDDPAAGAEQRIPDGLTDAEQELVSALADLLAKVRAPVKDPLELGPGVCLHVAALGVAPGYEGAGIGTRLLHAALSEAAARGFRFAFAECTSRASRRCHEKAGFRCLQSFSGSDLAPDGKHPFADCLPEIHLLWKRLRR